MADLQQSRYDKLIRRVANIVGTGAIVTETLQEVFPVFDLENVPPELLVLGGWRIAHRGTDIDPGANLTASQLFNPANSGQVIVLTSVTIGINVPSRVGWILSSTAIASSNGFGQFRDARAGDPTSDAAVGNTRIETPLTIIPQAAVRLLADDPHTLQDPNGVCVLMPGEGFSVGTQSNSVRLTVNYWWRERVLEPAEFIS